MPIPWLSVLSNIPWGQVVDGAPKVADAAGKLWTKVSESRKGGGAGPDGTPPAAQPEPAPAPAAAPPSPPGSTAPAEASAPVTRDELDQLTHHVGALQSQLNAALSSQREGQQRLQAELRDSSALIKALADQNAALVEQVDLAHRRMKTLLVAGVLSVLALGAGLAMLVMRS